MRQLHKKPSSRLRMRGFEYLMYSAFSSCLLLILLVLPLAPVFASETISEGQLINSEQAPVSSHTEDPIVPLSPEAEVSAQDQDNTGNYDVVIEHGGVVEESNAVTVNETDTVPMTTIESAATLSDGEEVVEAPVATQEEINSDEYITDVQEGEVLELVNEELQEELQDESETLELPVVDVETPEAENEAGLDPIDVIDDFSTTSSDEAFVESVDEVVTVNTVTTDENHFTFAKGECTTMSDGMFYCAKPTSSTTEVTHTDRVFSAADAGSDKEIYIEKNGEISAITENTFEDDAPYFDSYSNTIVWHRLIDGRYQIISYDIEEEEETQITHDRYNNMQPTKYGDLTVWQGWVGNDWEIFLLNEDELIMVTDNTTHDIAPSVNGTHIIWQSFETGVWQMKVYDMLTKAINTVEGTNGGSVQNPRFVLVYDTKFESGDIETRGYDLTSGKVVPLSAKPTQVPDQIPDPDQTGEKSALVTPPTQPKTKVDEGEDSNTAGGTGDDTPDILEGDLIVPSFTSTTPDSLPFEYEEVDVDDVTVPELSVENASSTDHISELIITPYVEPILPTP